ncbi:glycosyltransferase family 4 protein [Streptosporangiaceae bacterium NEAU-GS5]|nr:glycosyltransferase family 4 protein [Streptosporangiaceae bacterium NEAU-GS5]
MNVRYLLLHAYGMGGTIRTVISQANEMAARGHDVELVSVVRRREHLLFRLDPRVRLGTLADERNGRGPITFQGRILRRLRGKIVPRGEYAASFFTPAVEAAMVDYVSGLRDGVLVTTRPALNLAAARHAHPSVITVGQEHLNLASHREPVRAAITRHYPKLRALAVLTPTDRQDYERLLPGLPIVQIPNAVHGAHRRRSKLTAKTVIAAGRLHNQKGFDLLIPAFAEVAEAHPDWTLKIYGSGPKKHELRHRIDEFDVGDNVRLMGRAPSLEDELAESSIYVLSSRFEGLPMVMLEAMSHGLSIAAFDCPTGPHDVLTNEIDGLLVPPQDVSGLAAAINRLIEDPELRARLGEAALATAAGYAPEAVTPRWERLFAELAARD